MEHELAEHLTEHPTLTDQTDTEKEDLVTDQVATETEGLVTDQARQLQNLTEDGASLNARRVNGEAEKDNEN